MFWRQKEKNNKSRIYLDYAATTPVDDEVIKAMIPYFADDFGNASSIYKEGLTARNALDASRKKIADILNARSEEIIFTSGGTEANNLAIFGAIKAIEKSGIRPEDMHIITSCIEHPSVLEIFKMLEKKGLEVSYIGVDEFGIINPKDVRDAIQANTVLVSIMYVNNEIGTIQPIYEIAKIIRRGRKEKKSEIYFHTDASQAPLYLSIDVQKLGVDMMTLCGQKIYGPKGVGCLYKKKNIKLQSIISGGSQEMGLRAGTENIPLIIGFSKALELAEQNREKESRRLVKLRDYFMEELNKKIPQVKLNGSGKSRAPNNINVYIPRIDGEFFTIVLDSKGIACATKSACKENDEDKGSYIIEALGHSKERVESSLRFSLGKSVSKKDIDYVVKTLSESVKKYSVIFDKK